MAILGKPEKERLLAWYQDNGRHELPWRKLQTPWAIFVAESLLRRTKASTVAGIYPSLIDEFRCPEDVLGKKNLWQQKTNALGIASRANQFFSACEQLIQQHQGEVPGNYNDLITLPGVGHYIANAVISFGYHRPAYIIDTNTIRVASRVTGEQITQAEHRSKKAKRLLEHCFGDQDGLSPHLNFALLDLAFSICKPSKPDCNACPLSNCCQYSAAPGS
ncbi:hypothetical protein [Marinobacter zhejiangensis]|uniref:A/G-specific DNA-adenine glycosylase n=1 Tax=Marinobacter zhejiangensis TaxID=488535 RepID=A0A1I4NEM5_9GAMM|nr:hypothetical protein [Marinobacter zhejiangensis]SFM13663.1 A/G-specific DNA-adenine glycosylase [Marinobacter zhejiangensis]